jgi:phosphotransferase system enzyme I (PtsI)
MLDDSRRYLDERHIPCGNVRVGVMIEVPALAIIADKVAEMIDFASIGTNDLTQYTLAVDRLNPDVANYYQPYHPAVLRLIASVAEQFNKAGKPVGVCGEMGGDCYAAVLLIGLGIRRLSMNGSSVPKIKKIITRLSIKKAEELAQKILSCNRADQVRETLVQTIDILMLD